MINLRQFPQRIELTFWTALVHIMSAAPDFSRFVIKAGDFALARPNTRLPRQAIFWALAGLCLGFAFGLLNGWLSQLQ